MLRNRQLVMIGDSITLQFYTMIVCSLHGTIAGEYNLTWKDLSRIFGRDDCQKAEHCHLHSSFVFYPNYNTTITLSSEYMNHSFVDY